MGGKANSLTASLEKVRIVETIFKNGNVLTKEQTAPRAEGLAVQFGRIYKVGKTEEIEKLAGPETKIIDLKGQTLLPGFIDAHNRYLSLCLANGSGRLPAGGRLRTGARCHRGSKSPGPKDSSGKVDYGLGLCPLFARRQEGPDSGGFGPGDGKTSPLPSPCFGSRGGSQ